MKTCFICTEKGGQNWPIDSIKWLLENFDFCDKHKQAMKEQLENTIEPTNS